MALRTTLDINVDFYDKKYILINAKQLDKNSRFLSVTCYNHGELFHINSGEHAAYIRYKKADGYSVLNSCEINIKGKIIVELTEQMLAAEGICYADLIIVEGGVAQFDSDTGVMVGIEGSSILSTMTFCIDVSEAAVENSEIESNYDFDALNEALDELNAEYTEVILAARSWAIGGTDSRDGEDENNAKYYAQLAEGSKNSVDISEANALSYYKLSQSYAEGGTGVRENEDNDNSRYYYLLVRNIVDGLNSGFIPMGTISFSELEMAEKATGFTYNISDDFVTDDTFAEGAGKSYTAGTNVYYRSDGLWDCFGGAACPTANVDDVKEYLDI